MSQNYITNKSLILRIVMTILFFSVIILFVSTEYLKKTAVNTLASDDAKKTAQLVFETMNTRMQEGWTKKDLDGIIQRLEVVRKGMKISSYRSTQVEELFGVVKKDHDKVSSDPLIQKAMNGEEIFMVDDKTGEVRFLYPMHTMTECNHCHINAKDGSINGVLDISFPQSDIKISLDTISLYLIIFFILFLLLFAYLFFILINKKMVQPIVQLTNNIKTIQESKDLTKRVKINTNIEELGVLQNSFNQLLITIKYYYDKLIQKLYTDELTNINNLTKLQIDLENLKEQSTLLIVDIKAFGMINRVYGNNIADFLLKEFTKNTNKLLNHKGILYRLYGDEFAIIFKYSISNYEIETFLNKLKSCRYEYKQSEFILDVTVGYATGNTKEILEHATIALKAAKNKNKNLFKYDKTLTIKDEDTNHIMWLKKLEYAIKNDQIVPFFMPMKHTKTNSINKYETLVRIIDNGEIHTPDKFLDIALASGQYPIITQTVIRKTFEYIKDISDIKFSINLSLSDILNKETTDLLFYHLSHYKYSSNVIIELLETEEISDFKLLNKFITKVKEHGAKVAIDDFGSGYSNFNYILNLDIDIVKLDSCLIENLYTDQHSVVIVSNIVRISKELGLEVVAERVATQEIENILTIHEVDYLQGFHIGKPLKDILK